MPATMADQAKLTECGQQSKIYYDARMANVTDELARRLAQLPDAAGSVVVAFSGGMDSSVLLHALAQLPAARERGLRAIHIDHRLHVDSANWMRHCRAFADGLHVPFDSIAVEVERAAGGGLEDAARRARFSAFTAHLKPGEVLALAQHRDDQAETILLKLLRGAGPEGLGGMRVLRCQADAHLWRPLLELPRTTLADYAQVHALQWIEDPSNADTHLRRNFLRTQILPRLAQRWPEATAALAHSAMWARAAADFIDGQTQRALAQIRGADAATLAWRPWLALPDALRDPVLRLWLRALGLDEPAHFHVQELERQLRSAAQDRMPCVRWAKTDLRRYREHLHAMRALPSVPPDWSCAWDGTALTLPGGGTLVLQGQTGAAIKLPESLRVSYRRGGERLQPAGHAHNCQLRTLLQEAGIPPWLRLRIPLIYAGDALIAVGDKLASAAGQELCARHAARIVWATA